MNPPPLPDRSRGLTIAQLILSIAGVGLSILTIGILIVLSISTPWTRDITTSQKDQVLSLIWIAALVILLTIPSLVLSIRRLQRKPYQEKPVNTFLFASIAVLLAPLIIFLGETLNHAQSTPLGTTPVNILLVLIPIWWLFELGRVKLEGGSRQRLWGLTNFSIFITLPVVIVAEVIIFASGIVAIILWAIQQPEFASLWQQFQQQMTLDPLQLQNLQYDFLPLLEKPLVIGTIVSGITVVVPLVEEFFKPLAIWFLPKDKITPAQGFVAGMVCGATFALLESVFSLGAVAADTWIMTIAGRMAAGLLHIVTAGLNGWALASTWKDGKLMRLALTYVLTVLVHGLWNFSAIMLAVGQLGIGFNFSINPIFPRAAIWLLAALAIILVITLVAMNRSLRAQQLPPPLPTETPIQ